MAGHGDVFGDASIYILIIMIIIALIIGLPTIYGILWAIKHWGIPLFLKCWGWI